jgi:hypothetical protein
MKVNKKHICAYAQYNVKVKDSFTHLVHAITDLQTADYILGCYVGNTSPHKMILRPLSDLETTIDFISLIVCPKDYLNLDNYFDFNKKINHQQIHLLPYNKVQTLLSWHFDIFGLIDSGLAYNINNIKI